jgi:maltose alpha-D-glucosyltransferase/alpha-amylase
MAHPTVKSPPVPKKNLTSLLGEPPDLAKEIIGHYMVSVRLLGQRTAELHMALASVLSDSNFVPEPFTLTIQTELYHALRSFTALRFQLLRENLNTIPKDLKDSASKVLSLEDKVIQQYDAVRNQRIFSKLIRCHGDFHLGQVLYTGNDFVIIDFEGEPDRALSERRLKRSPLRDVAGMLRSFHYAAQSALQQHLTVTLHPEDDLPVLQQWANYWYTWVSAAYLGAYLETIRPAKLLPENPEELRILLNAFMLEKVAYEIGYELNNRPDWLKVPIQGILDLLETI